MENPPKEIKRKPSVEKKDVFNSMSVSLSKPSPSITANTTNMRKYISNSFSHRI